MHDVALCTSQPATQRVWRAVHVASMQCVQGRRMSQRSAAKRVNYNLEASDNEASGGGYASDDSEGGFQRLKRQAPPSAAARTSRVQSSQENASQEFGSSQREALPGSQTSRQRSITGGASGYLETLPEGEEKDLEEPVATQTTLPASASKAKVWWLACWAHIEPRHPHSRKTQKAGQPDPSKE